MRWVLHQIPLYKTEIESQLSQLLEAKVTIKAVDSVLDGFVPKLALQHIKIHSGEADALALKQVYISLSLLKLFYKPWLESLNVTLVGVKLSVQRLASGEIAITGLPSGKEAPNEQPTWIMQGNQYTLLNSEILWEDKKRHAPAIQLKQVNVVIHNRDEHHHISITADLLPPLGESLHLAMQFTGDMFTPETVNARLYAQGRKINFAALLGGDLPFNLQIKLFIVAAVYRIIC